MTTKKTEFSRYLKGDKSRSLIGKLTVPVTPDMQARVKSLKGTLDVNAYLRDKIEELLQEAG